jgi:predicted Zn-dependent protease
MTETLTITPHFLDLRVRAEFLDLCGEWESAEELRRVSMNVAREVDLTCYAYQLLWRGRAEEALALLHRNAEIHSDSWNVYDSLGEIYGEIGNIGRAIENYSRAAALVVDSEQAERIAFVLRTLRLSRDETAAMAS